MSTLTNDLLLNLPSATAAATAPSSAVSEPASDHFLLEATRTGDEAAFAEIINRYRNPITNYIYRLTSDYDTSVDLAQETFVRLYQAIDRYHTSYAFSTYIYRIATNLAISELRRRKRRRLVSLSSFFYQQHDEPIEKTQFDPPDALPLQDVTLVARERQAAVGRAIASLPEKYRVPVVLRDVEGRSYDDIAGILGMSEGTVKSRISRARGLLRDKLSSYL